jgi:hypothetical protein
MSSSTFSLTGKSKKTLLLIALASVLCVFSIRNSSSLSKDIAELKAWKGLTASEDQGMGQNVTSGASLASTHTTIRVATLTQLSPAYISRWERAIQEAEEMIANTDETPACLLPDKQRTTATVERLLAKRHKNEIIHDISDVSFKDPLVSLPVLNLGLPKVGSSTLAAFFRCVGLKGTHQFMKDGKKLEGICLRDAARLGLPPLQNCAPNAEFLMQMDAEYPFGHSLHPHLSSKWRDDCFFPQLELLEILHEEVPDATYVMNFRPLGDWIKSLTEWGDLLPRFSKCHLPNMPRGIPKDVRRPEHDMALFWCSHVLHVRHFVQEFPSHILIELDLYDSNTSAAVLSSLFPNRHKTATAEEQSCWGHANKRSFHQDDKEKQEGK